MERGKERDVVTTSYKYERKNCSKIVTK